MQVPEFTYKLLLLFFPGIVCGYIYDALTIHRDRQPFFFALQSFAFGLAAYLVYSLVVSGWFPRLNPMLGISLPTEVKILQSIGNPTVLPDFWEIIGATISGLVATCALVAQSTYKWGHRLAAWLGLTKKFGDLDVWGFVMNSGNLEWATIRDIERDLMYDGWVKAFSDDSKEAELLLQEVVVYKNSTAEELYRVPALYLSLERGKMSIEFRSPNRSDTPTTEQTSHERPEAAEQTDAPKD